MKTSRRVFLTCAGSLVVYFSLPAASALSDDAACDAAAIAMQLPGQAIKLQWSRADEFRWEPYGAAMAIELNPGLNSEGRVVDWKCELWSCPHSTRPWGGKGAGHTLYARHRKDSIAQPAARSIPPPPGGGDRNSVPLYQFQNMEVTKHLVTEMPIRVSALRSLGAFANIFAIESFMDELALHNSADPFDFRITHLGDSRAIAVLEKLHEISSWPQRPTAGNGNGWGIGFACYENLGAYAGILMQLRVDETSGVIALQKVFAVVDAGLIVNPDGARAQIEGGIIQSASWTLKEQLVFSRSEIQSRDWLSYPILGFEEIPDIHVEEIPDIHVEIVDQKKRQSLGVGEVAQGPTAAAIANAVFHATGSRLRDLPLTLGA